MDANKHTNRLLDAGKYLGEPLSRLGEKLCAAYRDGEMDGHACAMALAKYIEDHLRPVNKRHAALIQLTTKWLGESLDPPLESLFERTPYSKRQVQRLVERYFGMSPVALKRMYRGLRAAALLSLPTLTPEFEVMVYDAFYDQSHMIREIRLFAGRTPARLGDGESRFLGEMLDPKNFREIDSGSQDLI
jgi:AraC-like DNA-binding protein